MVTKHMAILTAVGLGAVLLSGPGLASWGVPPQSLGKKPQPAIGATDKATRLAEGKLRRPGPARAGRSTRSDGELVQPLRTGGQGDYGPPKSSIGARRQGQRVETVTPQVYVRETPPGPAR